MTWHTNRQPTAADRLALAMCVAVLPGSKPCQSPCHACRVNSAAVARELAEQVAPDEPDYMRSAIHDQGWWDKQDGIRAEILAIAAELEGHHG